MVEKNNLQKAKIAKNDEFYTQLSDIEKELRHYKQHFKNKVVFCNCDDPEWSNFWLYFKLNFNVLRLKKLISTHYDQIENTYKLEYDGVFEKKTNLQQNGDFRSPECIEILKESDIVVTNPPFSLFREYVNQLINYNKKFLILGNINAITYKEIFPLFKNNNLWYGPSISSGDRKFEVPNNYPLKAAGCGIDENGKRYIRVKGVRWFTNLDIPKRHEILETGCYYSGHENEYPKYDNYNAVNVNRVKDIPEDYMGVMGVPITFMDKYCPEQFEIIELGNSRENFTPSKDYINPKKHTKEGKIINGNAINCVLAIEYNECPTGVYYTSDNSKFLLAPYARILIRRKENNNEN